MPKETPKLWAIEVNLLICCYLSYTLLTIKPDRRTIIHDQISANVPADCEHNNLFIYLFYFHLCFFFSILFIQLLENCTPNTPHKQKPTEKEAICFVNKLIGSFWPFDDHSNVVSLQQGKKLFDSVWLLFNMYVCTLKVHLFQQILLLIKKKYHQLTKNFKQITYFWE